MHRRNDLQALILAAALSAAAALGLHAGEAGKVTEALVTNQTGDSLSCEASRSVLTITAPSSVVIGSGKALSIFAKLFMARPLAENCA